MSIVTTRRQRRALAAENKRWPECLVEVPKDDWPLAARLLNHKPERVLRSRGFLVQVMPEPNDIVRLTICRTSIDSANDWRQGISWEELQLLKNQAGYSDSDAIEIFPASRDVVNVANMRHLWVMPERLAFAWRSP